MHNSFVLLCGKYLDMYLTVTSDFSRKLHIGPQYGVFRPGEIQLRGHEEW